MCFNRFEQVKRVAEQVRQEYGKRYTTRRAQLSEVVKLTAELSELRADKRHAFTEGSHAGDRAQEIERRLDVIQGQRQPTLEQLFRRVCK